MTEDVRLMWMRETQSRDMNIFPSTASGHTYSSLFPLLLILPKHASCMSFKKKRPPNWNKSKSFLVVYKWIAGKTQIYKPTAHNIATGCKVVALLLPSQHVGECKSFATATAVLPDWAVFRFLGLFCNIPWQAIGIAGVDITFSLTQSVPLWK